MPQHQLNIARLHGAPEVVAGVEKLLDDYHQEGEYAMLPGRTMLPVVRGTLVVRTSQQIQKLNEAKGELYTEPVDKAGTIPFALFSNAQRLETYGGAASGIEHVATFLAGCLNLPTRVETIRLDLVEMVHAMRNELDRFRLVGATITNYAHNSYVIGRYAAKFADTEQGLKLLSEHADEVASISVKFGGGDDKVTARVSPNATIQYTCGDDARFEAARLLRATALAATTAKT
ncbi:MAG: hypothetical protein ACOC46_04735 [Pirellulales bacterium]